MESRPSMSKRVRVTDRDFEETVMKWFEKVDVDTLPDNNELARDIESDCEIVIEMSSQSKLNVYYSNWEKFTNVDAYVGSIEDAISTDYNLNLSSKCCNEVEKYIYGVKEKQKWALSMFDSNGKMESGLLKGNIRHMGSFDECISVNEDFDNITLIGKYCLADLIVNDVNIENGTETKFKGALCFPGGCTAEEIQQIHHAINISIYPTSSECYLRESKSFDGVIICAIIVFGIILCLVVTSTTYELTMQYSKKSPHVLFKSFSLMSNGKSLLTVTGPKDPNQFSCICGIRVFATVWIILFHLVDLKKGIIANELYFNEWMQTVASKILVAGPLSVDTFLLITGMLISFNHRKSLNKTLKFNIIKHYLNRYFRLTPTLALIVLVRAAFVPYLGFGPLLTIQNVYSANCRRYWWSALLYVQNFVNADDICIQESWYLCVDMQIFLVSPFFLIPLRRKPKIALSVIAALLLISLGFSFASVWVYDMTNPKNYLKNYYMMPYFRVSPWFLGLIMEYHLSVSQETKLIVGKATRVLLTVTSLASIIFCIYAHPTVILSGQENQILYAGRITLIRPLWCMATWWIIYSCVHGYNDFLNNFLSLNAFQVLSKITYAAYLVHLTIISLFHSISRTATVLSATTVFMEGCAYLVIIALTSTVITLFVEIPALVITKYSIRA
ncbi:hypothetical protein FQA39_LY16786 [Lamprigera yunnana]|nr:hypothetical protein FQA39_LY16786 [Lamprigera yunnana]